MTELCNTCVGSVLFTLGLSLHGCAGSSNNSQSSLTIVVLTDNSAAGESNYDDICYRISLKEGVVTQTAAWKRSERLVAWL